MVYGTKIKIVGSLLSQNLNMSPSPDRYNGRGSRQDPVHPQIGWFLPTDKSEWNTDFLLWEVERKVSFKVTIVRLPVLNNEFRLKREDKINFIRKSK